MQTITQTFYDNSVYKWRSTQSIINVAIMDLTAKGDSTDSINAYRLYQDGQLKDDIKTAPVYATLEENQYILDGSIELLPETLTDEQIGWWSVMSDEDGRFETTPCLTIPFSNIHSSIGLTLYYDEFSYPLEVKVEWYYNGALTQSGIYTNSSNIQGINEPVNFYDEIRIYFTRAKSYAYVKLLEVDFGIYMVLTGADLQGASITEHISLISNTLSPDELTFNIINYDDTYDVLNPHDLLTYFKQGQLITVQSGVLNRETEEYEYIDMGMFYMDSFTSNNGIITLKAYAVLNKLNNEYYYSEWFENKTVEYIASKILDGYQYYVHPNVKDITLTGYIPLSSKKEALKTLAISCNAVIKEGRDGKIYIYQSTEDLSSNQIIAEDTVYTKSGLAGILEAGVMAMPSVVEPEPYVLTIARNQRLSEIQASMIGYYHKVEVSYNTYTQSGTSETLFDGDITTDGEGVAIIKYNTPVYDLTGSTGDFTLYHFADCTVVVGNEINATYSITITGYKYVVDTALISSTKELNDNVYDESRLTMTLDSNNTLLNYTQAKSVADWLLNQLQKRKDVEFDWWSMCGVEASDYAKLITSYDEEYVMQISEIKYDLVNLIANVKGVL